MEIGTRLQERMVWMEKKIISNKFLIRDWKYFIR